MIFFVVLFLKSLGSIYIPFVLSWMSRCINLSTLDVRPQYTPRKAARIKINSWFSQIGKVCDCHFRLNPNRQLSLRIPLWDLCRTGINLLVRSSIISSSLNLSISPSTPPHLPAHPPLFLHPSRLSFAERGVPLLLKREIHQSRPSFPLLYALWPVIR